MLHLPVGMNRVFQQVQFPSRALRREHTVVGEDHRRVGAAPIRRSLIRQAAEDLSLRPRTWYNVVTVSLRSRWIRLRLTSTLPRG